MTTGLSQSSSDEHTFNRGEHTPCVVKEKAEPGYPVDALNRKHSSKQPVLILKSLDEVSDHGFQ
jgi:hypothetical protein